MEFKIGDRVRVKMTESALPWDGATEGVVEGVCKHTYHLLLDGSPYTPAQLAELKATHPADPKFKDEWEAWTPSGEVYVRKDLVEAIPAGAP